MFSHSGIALSLAAVLILPWLEARAQETTAVCETGFSWMFNDNSQSPCLVAAYLMAPCLADPFEAEVLGLVSGLGINAYPPPGPAGFYLSSTCMCSSVTYSLLNACSLCQGFTEYTWAVWTAACSSAQISNGSYPDTIPSVVSVPTWAFLSVAATGRFDVQAAESVAAKGSADVSATVTAGAATTPAIGTSLTFSEPPFTFSEPSFTIPSITVSIPTVSLASTEFTKKKRVNVGAIVGGVVGGISALLTTLGGIWAWMKKRAKNAVGAGNNNTSVPPSTPMPDPEKLNVGSPSAVPSYSTEYFPTTLDSNPSQPHDNPDDPSTFPDAHSFSNPAPGWPNLTPSATPPVPPHTATPSSSGYQPTQY